MYAFGKVGMPTYHYHVIENEYLALVLPYPRLFLGLVHLRHLHLAQIVAVRHCQCQPLRRRGKEMRGLDLSEVVFPPRHVRDTIGRDCRTLSNKMASLGAIFRSKAPEAWSCTYIRQPLNDSAKPPETLHG